MSCAGAWVQSTALQFIGDCPLFDGNEDAHLHPGHMRDELAGLCPRDADATAELDRGSSLLSTLRVRRVAIRNG